jgi:hypothetical protein
MGARNGREREEARERTGIDIRRRAWFSSGIDKYVYV